MRDKSKNKLTRTVKVYDKKTKKLLIVFEQDEGICDKALHRKIFFKYGINPKNAIIKSRKHRKN